MKLNFESLQNNTAPKTLEKAKDYINKFKKITLQGDILRGEVKGSSQEVYEVEVCCTDNNYLKSSCTCPAQMDFCKHAAALCLTYLSEESKKTPKSTTLPEQCILDMDETFLKEKLLSLLPEFPGLLEKLAEGSQLQISKSKSQEEESEEDWESWEF